MKLLLPIPVLLFAVILLVNSVWVSSIQAKSSAGEDTESPIKIGTIHDITVLAHPICGFQLPKDNNPDHYIFAEGDICPVGGGPCHYHAVMNINGSDVALPRVASESTHAVFKSPEWEVRVDYIVTQCPPHKKQCVPAVERAALTIRQGQHKKQIKVKAYCGEW